MNTTTFGMTIADDLWTVSLSVGIAVLATYVALELAGRIDSAADRLSARLWLVAGAVAMGSGIWSMHFTGMSAADYPFAARYSQGLTVVSWLIAVLVSAAALGVASHRALPQWMMFGGAAAVGVGATFMHFVGMAALDIAPAMVLDSRWVVAAVAVAIIGTALVLYQFEWLRDTIGPERVRRQCVAALAFGASLASMHYIGMAAVTFPPGTVCTSTKGLEVENLGLIAGGATIVFLALMLLVIGLERRAQDRAKALSQSLDSTQRELNFVTFNDAVTGLPNRIVFQDRLKQAAARQARHKGSLATLVVELDDFGELGNAWHESARTELLKSVATRLSKAIRASDTVANAGADQFLVLLEEVDAAESAARVAQKIVDLLRPAFFVDQRQIRFTASVGISMAPDDGDWNNLIGNAGTALAAARKAGGNRYAFFERSMDEAARVRFEWLDELRAAIEGRQFELHYQPKVIAATTELAGVEALIRWHHPTRGMVSPMVFIPLAEQFGLIDDLGRWVIHAACRQMQAWEKTGVLARVAINLSTHQLRDPGLPDEIASALATHGVDPARLTCEITESVAMDDSTDTGGVFEKLRATGVNLSIDDFGTGYSNLSYLRKLPVEQLKIDRSFVKDVADDDNAGAVVRGIIDLAHALKLEVVAEGVETEAQRLALVNLGCDKLQGYLFARPMNAEALALWFREAATRPPAVAGMAPRVSINRADSFAANGPAANETDGSIEPNTATAL